MYYTRHRTASVMLALGLGILCAWLRLWLYNNALEPENLLGRPSLQYLLAAITAVSLLVFLLLARLSPLPEKRPRYPRASDSAFVCLLLASPLLMIGSVINYLTFRDIPAILCAALGICAGVCLVPVAVCRRGGHWPNEMFHAVLTVFCLTFALCYFRRMGHGPQLLDYVFQLFAWISLMLCAYHRCVYDCDRGGRWRLEFFSLCAQFFCLVSLTAGEDTLLYLGGLLWAVTALPSPRAHTFARHHE